MGNHYRCADVHSGNSCGEHLEENMTEIDKNMNVSLISHFQTTFCYDFLHRMDHDPSCLDVCVGYPQAGVGSPTTPSKVQSGKLIRRNDSETEN